MKKLLFPLFIFCSFFSLSEQIKITDDLNYSTTHKNINHSFVKLEMLNDYNPIFNNRPADDNFTLGESVFLRLKSHSTPNYFDIAIESDLYTDYQKDKFHFIGTRLIKPQYFVEISYLSMQYQYFISKYKAFLSIGGGVGVNNKKNAIEGLALYMQGGKDGKGGYHALLKNNPGEDNLPSGGIEPLIFISPSIIKNFSIDSPYNFKNKPFLQLQTGFRLGNSQIGNSVFFNTKADLPVVQFIYNQHNSYLLSIILQNDITYHQNGFLFSPEFGLENQFSFLTIGFTSIFNLGNQNIYVYKYVKNVPLMRLYLRFNL